jgi:GTPase SAR1 family protein
MEYLSTHLTWLRDELNRAGPTDDEHFIIDCPGQIELYTHVPAIKTILRALKSWGYTVSGTFLVDAAMVIGDISKYLSAVLLATSAMVQLEMPWINVLSKVDLIPEDDAELFCEVNYGWARERLIEASQLRSKTRLGERLSRLNKTVCSLLEDFSMVRFLPLDSGDPESVDTVLQHIDLITQYGEDLEPREPREGELEDDAEADQ